MIAERPRLRNRSTYIQPVFVDGPIGRLLFTCFRPAPGKESRNAVICLPPFAEEMNKSRRMLALQGRMLAEQGITFLLPDLFATGDSDGEFGQATWSIWREDALFAIDWFLREGYTQLHFLTLRAGCLLFQSVSAELTRPLGRVAMWAPVISGRKMLDQFFRTRLVTNMQSGATSGTTEVRGEIQQAGKIDIAGYRLSHELTRAIDGLNLVDMHWAPGQQVLWMDVSPASTTHVPASAKKLIETWKNDAARVQYHRLKGPQFWMSPEIEEVPGFLPVTTRFLS